ncbi:MAG: Crp/Fnr family transcriptional regulator [Alphaproteobacteria bacterium]
MKQPIYEYPVFRDHQEIWQQVAPSLHKKTFHKNNVVFHHGNPAHHLWVVLSGWVKIIRQTPDGKETVISLCTAGDLFGEAALFAEAHYPYNAEIIGESAELLAIPSDILRQLVNNHPSLASSIMALLNERTSQAQLKLEHMSTMSAAQRLGCFFLRLCQSQLVGEKTLEIPIEKHLLAAYLGMKPETLSRSQQQLKNLGVAIDGHLITIEEIARLRHFVCNSCSESGTGGCGVDSLEL